MKARLLILSLILSCSFVSTAAFADDPPVNGNCPEGQIEKSFQDGASVSYQCLEPGAAMIDDTDIQFGGEGEENGSGGAEPPDDEG